jgi:crotonobetainyl-CoA:carnitine CoA-transferase CaiB-like acyl-CoA transferase
MMRSAEKELVCVIAMMLPSPWRLRRLLTSWLKNFVPTSPTGWGWDIHASQLSIRESSTAPSPLLVIRSRHEIWRGVLAAVRLRDATGVGPRVDVTMPRSLPARQATAFLGTGVSPGTGDNQHSSIALYQTLHGRDGQIALACGNVRQFRNLRAAWVIDEIAGARRFATNTERVSHRGGLTTLLETATTTFTVQDLRYRLRQAGVPSGPVNSIDAAFALAEHLALDPAPRWQLRRPRHTAGEQSAMAFCHTGALWSAAPQLPKQPQPQEDQQ